MYNIGVCGVGRESGCVISCYVGFLGVWVGVNQMYILVYIALLLLYILGRF